MSEESIATESQAQAGGRLILPGSILVWLGVWAALSFGVQPPIPGSVMNLYMSIVTVSILVYVVADQARVVHEEHGPIELGKGNYRVWRQREYSSDGDVDVMD